MLRGHLRRLFTICIGNCNTEAVSFIVTHKRGVNVPRLLVRRLGLGARLRAAIGAGWFEAPETVKREILQNGRKHYEHLFDGQEVGDMTPAVVWLIGQEIDQIYNDMTTIDPN